MEVDELAPAGMAAISFASQVATCPFDSISFAGPEEHSADAVIVLNCAVVLGSEVARIMIAAVIVLSVLLAFALALVIIRSTKGKSARERTQAEQNSQ